MKKTILIFALAAATMMSCGDDDSNTPVVEDEKISIEDGNAVASSLTIQGSTTVQGNPPAPSTDPDAPVVADAEDATAINGNNLILPVSQVSGTTIGGVYLKVKGSDSYFDIPASALGNSGGRLMSSRKAKNQRQLKINEDVSVDILLPDNLEPGTFCVEYCIYDPENRVSNIVEVCIDVLEFGGENSAFLSANQWEMVSEYYKEIYNGETYEGTVLVGESDIYTYETDLYCNDGSTQTVTVEEVDRLDYLYVTFGTDGGFLAESSNYEKWMDYQNSNCQTGVVYHEETDTEDQVGAWAYDDALKSLTLVLEEEDVDDQGNVYTETYVEVFDIKVESGNLILIYEEETSDYYDYFEITFKPKN